MKVSIITVCFNAEKFLAETIESVLSQNYKEVEYIVIDGLSTDSSIKIINKYRNKISYFVSERDNGMYDAMNKGLAIATGDIIGILNAGDVYFNDSVISEVVQKISNKDALYADLNYVKENNVLEIVRSWKSGIFNLKSFKFGWMPPHPTLFVRKSKYLEFGNYRIDYKTAADYELMLRLFYKNNCSAAYLNKVIVNMRTGGVSNSKLSNRLNANREDRKAWRDNDLKPFWFTFLLKPTRKIVQYLNFFI